MCLGLLLIKLFIWNSGQVTLHVVNVTWTDLDSLAVILSFFNNFCIASRLVCSFIEAMAGSLSVATTAVSLANYADVDSDEVSGLQYITDIIMAPGFCPGVHRL
jgi:hypothetical protein